MLTEAGSLGEFHFVSRLRSRGNPQQEFFSSFLVSFMSIYWGSASLCTHKTAETIWNHEVIRVRMVSSMYIYIISVYILCIYLPGPCKSTEFYSLRVYCWWLPGHRFLLIFLEDSTIHRHHSKGNSRLKTVYEKKKLRTWHLKICLHLQFSLAALRIGNANVPFEARAGGLWVCGLILNSKTLWVSLPMLHIRIHLYIHVYKYSLYKYLFK